jgi:hypothetical protein
MPPWIRSALVRLYPRAWRTEYGDELRTLLCDQPLTVGVVFDVVRSAFWQRVRANVPAMSLGGACLLLFTFGIVLTPTSYASTMPALVEPSSITFPTLRVTFFESFPFMVLLVLCGWWTQVRRGRGAAGSGVWLTLIAGLPVSALGFLLWIGVVHITFPAASPTGQGTIPHAVAMMIAPLMRAPESAIWSAIGGRLGRWVASR